MIDCSDTSTKYVEVELNKEFNIKAGDSAVLVDQGLVMKFILVADDSRCPIGAVCVWEGNAAAEFELRNSKGEQTTVKLNTNAEPKNMVFSGLVISLKNLSPHPKLDEIVNPSDYYAALLVQNSK